MTKIANPGITGFSDDDHGMIDISESEFVEVIVDNDRLWVNIDGICRLRAANLAAEVVLTGSHKNIHRLGVRKRTPTTEEGRVD